MLVEEMSAETGLCKGLKPKAVRHRGFSAEHESRILRVSRLTGGKDRHSKVWTYKGARDRRVRLSVPTAIKFYDLQDRLRFEQPSMVIDWLINEAKAAIDELPALPPELPSVSQITSSNGSPIKAEGSSVTATATAGTGPGPGPAPGPPMLSAEAAAAVQDEQSKTQSPRKPQDGHLSCSPAQELDLGRSTSSTSDGSIKGEYRFPSKSAAIIRAKKREHARERTKNKPKASRKSPQRQHHHKLLNENMSKPLSVTEQWRGTSSPLPILRTATAHNFYGNGGMPSNNTLQQLLDDTVTLPSYSDMLCTQDSTTNPMHHMDSTSNTGITRSQPPSNNISVIGGTTTSTAALQCYELELAVSCLDQKQHRIAEENNSTMSQIQTSIPIFDLMRTMENPTPQLPISHLEMHFSSGLMPNNELNNLWSLSSRGPLQSNIVAAHMTAGLPHKNTYEDYSSGYSQVFRLQ